MPLNFHLADVQLFCEFIRVGFAAFIFYSALDLDFTAMCIAVDKWVYGK